MSAQQLLLQWIAELTNHLDEFQGQVSPPEDKYQTTWETFQKDMSTLLAPTSGAEAFVGEAANTIRAAFSQCASAEQAFQRENVMGKAVQVCKTCMNSIDSAIADTSPRMTKLDLVEQVLESMTVDDIVKYGADMVPIAPFAEAALKHDDVLNPLIPIVPAYDQKARDQEMQEIWQTHAALLEMARRIQEATQTWNESILALGGEDWPAEFLKQVSEDWNKTNTALELAGKIKIGDFELKGLGEFMEKKGTYLALIGFLLEFASGKKYTTEAFFSDLYGTGIGLIPGVDEFTLYAEIAHDSAPVLGWLQNNAASGIAGNDQGLRQALEEPVKGIKEGGAEIDFGSVLNDLGGVVYNLGPSSLSIGGSPPIPFPSYALFHGGERNLPVAEYDLQRATVDSMRLVQGTEKLAVDTTGAVIDDGIGLVGKVTHTQGVARSIIGGVNRVLGWLGG